MYRMITGSEMALAAITPQLFQPIRTREDVRMKTYAVEMILPDDMASVRAKENNDPVQDLEVQVPPRPDRYPYVDPDLRQLIAQCLICEPDKRPQLPALLAVVEQMVRDRGEAFYQQLGLPGKMTDTDVGLRHFVQKIILEPNNTLASALEEVTGGEDGSGGSLGPPGPPGPPGPATGLALEYTPGPSAPRKRPASSSGGNIRKRPALG